MATPHARAARLPRARSAWIRDVFTTTIQAAAARPGAALVNDAGEVVGVQAAGATPPSLLHTGRSLRALPVVVLPRSRVGMVHAGARARHQSRQEVSGGARRTLRRGVEVFRRRTRENPSMLRLGGSAYASGLVA